MALAAALLTSGGTLLVSTSVGAVPGQHAGDNGRAHQVQTDPQPASNADFSGNGANVHGPYDSTRDGSPSGNGNGGGQAVGKPSAGSVGKADNKNPPGQLPGGSDGNAGYECDRNHGIGRTNPAHTGCTTTVTSPTTESSPPPPDSGSTPPGSTPPGPGSTPPGSGGTPGSEDDTSVDSAAGSQPPPDSSSKPQQASGPHPEVVAGVSTTESTGSLAATGAPVMEMIGWSLGSLLVGVGLAVVGRSRRRRTPVPASPASS